MTKVISRITGKNVDLLLQAIYYQNSQERNDLLFSMHKLLAVYNFTEFMTEKFNSIKFYWKKHKYSLF